MKTALQILIGTTGYIVWGVFAYIDPMQRVAFLNTNIAMALGTIGLVLRDMPPSQPAPAVQPVVLTITKDEHQ
jgi:hypothetical protein